jgi:uncharacterized protein
MSKQFDSRRLDVVRFAEEEAKLEGQASLGKFERLLAETAGEAIHSSIVWTARGELRQPGRLQPQVWLHLTAQASLPVICQRCLDAVQVPLEANRWVRLAPDETIAATEDDESEEDVLVQSRSFDLMGLIEDELLMALPLAPRHDVCPTEPKRVAGQQEFDAALSQRENPFAVLGKLKGKP